MQVDSPSSAREDQAGTWAVSKEYGFAVTNRTRNHARSNPCPPCVSARSATQWHASVPNAVPTILPTVRVLAQRSSNDVAAWSIASSAHLGSQCVDPADRTVQLLRTNHTLAHQSMLLLRP